MASDYNSPIQERLREKLSPASDVLESAKKRAKELLEEDIKDPNLNGSPNHPDRYMLRANEIAKSFLYNRFFDYAAWLYEDLIRIAEEHCKATGDRRHIGALHANLGITNLVRGRLDEGIVGFFRAAQDDIQSYGIPTVSHSYAITGLLEDNFSKPITSEVLSLVKTVNANVTESDVVRLRKELGDLQYAFLSYVHTVGVHLDKGVPLDNAFSQLQVHSSIRSLCAIFEAQLKKAGGISTGTLRPAIDKVFSSASASGGKAWWKDYARRLAVVESSKLTPRTPDDELKGALATPITDSDSVFWKSLLVTYIARNHTTHEMEMQSALVQQHAEETLAHILNAMTLLPTAV